MNSVFIDGSAGTTGLRIRERLLQRPDLSIISLPENLRKNPEARRDAMNQAEIVFLCLPDAAAIEAATLVENPSVRVIDTSTSHRTNPAWVYGYPELNGQRQLIQETHRIANPGCHASGFIALVAPLVQAGLIDKDLCISSFSLTGYSGGGKNMIAEYEAPDRPPRLKGPRQYALSQQHKHLKEMVQMCGLTHTPVFCPIVGDFYSGMEVTVPLFAKDVHGNAENIRELYQQYYARGLIRYADNSDPDGMLSAAAFSGRDDMQVSVFGNEERILLTARFDNLGKGASGAAIQNMNLLLGVDETTGLNI